MTTQRLRQTGRQIPMSDLCQGRVDVTYGGTAQTW